RGAHTTMAGDILAGLEKICPDGIREGVAMAAHTTIATGGPARYFATPRNAREVVALVRFALSRGVDFLAVGRGSNLLVRDGGYDGLVIKIAGNMRQLRILTRTAHAEGGVSFTRLGKTLTRAGRPGFEFAIGIPGSVGGAVKMNAGAFGWDTAMVLKSTRVVDGNGRVIVLTPNDLGFAYRHSRLPDRSIVLSAIFNCPPGKINEDVLERSRSRNDTQPLSQKSFGSTFKNPPGGFAAELIDECGLKGTREGGAMVSEKHANFLVNISGDAKASDIEDLMGSIVKKVKARFGVTLEPEVKIIGDR
ncbi:MAG: UDP-N-acetylmuramate dehydrogenase, partial [bacterium]